MTLAIHNTTTWPEEKLLAYGREITAAMRKFVERFPREVTIQYLAQEIIAGKKQLWLIMDGERFVSFVLTEIQTNDATGAKTLLIPSFAGDEGTSTVPLIVELENWGIENGCTEARTLGRKGWTKPMAEQGYRMDAVLFRKPLERAA
ncbi:MAG: hypothetical protein E5X86_19880 [Mesorhizobium sp.]|uniref:hypothetical protein n=1 Tax=Mesorhizobium sp. TaxID=1871066 RepID=UPI001201563D|nr:hypothetical protein [Mesorhizobium sp.]TIO15631.1 MAG: hypothetical protein E5X86_19880 [Mesorhizobium sp.]